MSFKIGDALICTGIQYDRDGTQLPLGGIHIVIDADEIGSWLALSNTNVPAARNFGSWAFEKVDPNTLSKLECVLYNLTK